MKLIRIETRLNRLDYYGIGYVGIGQNVEGMYKFLQ